MSDEKLIDALRRMSPRLDMLDCENVLTAADRISAQAAEIERMRGDLKRAVELLGQWRLASAGHVSVRSVIDKHDATLAELTGGKDE